MSNDLERLHATLTSKHWTFRYLNSSECPATLLGALKKELPHIESSSWKERFQWGGVYVNGQEVIEDLKLSAPTSVEYYEPKFNLDEAHKIFSAFTKENVVYEDSDLIAVYKPPKLSCVQSREQRHYYLKLFVEQYLGKPVHMPSRLDTSAQGLVIMSKSKRMHKHLQQAFERHSIEKYYVLAVSPQVEWKRKLIKNKIGEDPRHPILRKIVSEGGQDAETHFKVLYNEKIEGEESSVLLAKPKTGRTHQLRVHTSSLGHPIIGDNFYSGIKAHELHLLCLRVRFFNNLIDKFTEIQLPNSLLPSWVKPAAVDKNLG